MTMSTSCASRWTSASLADVNVAIDGFGIAGSTAAFRHSRRIADSTFGSSSTINREDIAAPWPWASDPGSMQVVCHAIFGVREAVHYSSTSRCVYVRAGAHPGVDGVHATSPGRAVGGFLRSPSGGPDAILAQGPIYSVRGAG